MASRRRAPPPVPDDIPKCHFLSLPAELRTQIFDYYLDSFPRQVKLKNPIYSSKRCVLRQNKDIPLFKFPALLQTCGQIRSEAGSIHYGNTTFYFCTSEHLREFAKIAGRHDLKMIRTFRLSRIQPDARQARIEAQVAQNWIHETMRTKIKADLIAVQYYSDEVGEDGKEVIETVRSWKDPLLFSRW